LFANLTSNDSHRANMAITFGGNQHERGHSLTIFLKGKGATVFICPMCMKHYGVKKSDLLPGLKVGRPELTGGALFKDNTKTLTW
jgi:hypothetical protein